MIALHLLSCVVAIVALAHLFAGRVPDFLFVLLPFLFFVPDLFYMESNVWGTVPEWLTLVLTFAAVVLAAKGFHTWKRQLIAEKDYDLAVRIAVREALRTGMGSDPRAKPGAIVFCFFMAWLILV